jgi:DNA invertase Pin-like site-specific DNA recombinase
VRDLKKSFRCAIYTRKSTEHGLELEFNSLDAQREACEAYIKSQGAEGWQPIPDRYDDAAYSGGDMDRPALQKMLKDIASGQIDIVVVYKIDRLTRSLADFAKLVEAFEGKSVSFVAVTQQFNSTTSMGRLTLNVLLSFAQFERELASERVRDKIAASRRKGKWTGGSAPLGYDVNDKKLVVNGAEAKLVRMIFARYLALKSFGKLVDELNEKGTFTKKRLAGGKTVGGIPFTYGPLAYLLKNRTYLGQTHHNGQWFAGEHEAIIPQETFEQIQKLLKENTAGRTGRRCKNGALLSGLLFDDRGNRMSPSFTTKHGARYPFYVSSALLRGRKLEAGSMARIAAQELEAKVLDHVRDRTNTQNMSLTQRELFKNFVERVVVRAGGLTITLKDQSPVDLAWFRSEQRVSTQADKTGCETKLNAQLVQALVRSFIWLKWLNDGTYKTIEELARVIKLHPKVIRHRIRLAFLAPEVVGSILNGSYDAPVTIAELCSSASLSWRQQRKNGAHSRHAENPLTIGGPLQR